MTPQTALDELGRAILWRYRQPDQTTLDGAVRYQRHWFPTNFSQALQDPRYLGYCKEQDRKEEEHKPWTYVVATYDCACGKCVDKRTVPDWESPEYLAQKRSFVYGQMMDD